MKKWFQGFSAVLAAALFLGLLGAPAPASAHDTAVDIDTPYYQQHVITLGDGASLEETIISGPPHPPLGISSEIAARPEQTETIKTLSVPGYNWVFGCSAVSGAMIAAYYDRGSYPNMYTGPTNGGVMPMDNSVWGTWSDGADIYPSNPLVASQLGVDGRPFYGSIDDYWSGYLSGLPDPFIGQWNEHIWGDAIGDYMKTSQLLYGNDDGSTHFYTLTSAGPLTCSQMEGYTAGDRTISQLDGTYGRKLFYQARGYTVTDCYNQKTDTNGGGFTFASYKAEIDAGRPVLLNLQGHSVVGVGYDDATQTVYLNDTWNYSLHTMYWTGLYEGMGLRSVSIVNLLPPLPGWFGKNSPTPGAANQPKNQTLYWSSSSGAASYEYCIDETPGSTCEATWITTGAATSASITLPKNGTPYYWQVRARNTAGTIEANDGTWWSFTSVPAPTLTTFSPASDIPGRLVTLTGTGFSGTTMVKFGSIAASFTVLSDTQINTVVPPGAAAGKITVTTLNGTATSATDFVVPVIQASQDVVSVAENAGFVSVPVQLTATASLPVTVNFATGSGTATAGADYTATSGTLTFPAGQTTASITIPVLDDTLDEPDEETLTLTLSSPGGTTLGARTSTMVKINDNDAPPEVSFAAASYTAGEGAESRAVTVKLSAASGKTITVNYATANGTAAAGQDFTAASGTLTFTPGQTSKDITIPLTDDALDEPDTEQFTVALSSPVNASLGTPSTATIDVTDNDTPPVMSLSMASYTAAENAGVLTVTVTLSSASARTVTVNYATDDGTALASQDYTAKSGTLTFLPGETSKQIAITLLDDSAHEAEEAFTIELSGPVNAAVPTPGAACAITDDDPDLVYLFLPYIKK